MGTYKESKILKEVDPAGKLVYSPILLPGIGPGWDSCGLGGLGAQLQPQQPLDLGLNLPGVHLACRPIRLMKQNKN